jgi:uncharacterized delta-60 repeat protein
MTAVSTSSSRPARGFNGAISLLVVGLLVGPGNALAAAGDLDPSFGSGGVVTREIGSYSKAAVRDSLLQPDGKLVVAGQAISRNGSGFALARYNPDGSLDSSFGSGGQLLTIIGDSAGGTSVVRQPDGKLVVAGTANVSSSKVVALARYNADGSLDSSFGTGGKVTTNVSDLGAINALALQADGKLVVAGSIDASFALLRYNADGSLDTSFGTGGTATMAPGNQAEARDLVVQSDGKLVAAGKASGDFAVARFNTDGAADLTFGTGGSTRTAVGGDSSEAYALVLQPDGKLVAGGHAYFSDSNDHPIQLAMARYLSNGAPDPTFGTAGKVVSPLDFYARAADLALQPDGKVVAVGDVGNGSQGKFLTARYQANGSLDTGFGSGGKVIADLGDETQSYGLAEAIQPDGAILVSGHTSSASGQDFATVRYQASGSIDAGFGTNGVAQTAINQTSDSEAVSVTALPDGKLLTAGTTKTDDGHWGRPRLALTRLSASGATDPSFGTNGTAIGPAGRATGAAVQPDGKIVVLGADSAFSAGQERSLVRFQTDGTIDTSFGSGGSVHPDLYARFAGKPVTSQADGKIVIAGSDIVDPALARYNPDGSVDTSFGSSGEAKIFAWDFGYFKTVITQNDGKLVALGHLDGAEYLWRFNQDGSRDTSFDGDGKALIPSGGPDDLAIQPDGRIVVAGWDQGSFELLRYLPDGSPDTTFDGDGVMQTQKLTDLGNGEAQLALQPDGSIIGAAHVYQRNIDPGNADPNSAVLIVLRVSPSGQIDSSFGQGGREFLHFTSAGGQLAYDLALQADGKAVVAGGTTVDDPLFGRLGGQLALARIETDAPPPPPTPPETTIDQHPSATTSSTDATFEFSSTTAGATFECSLDQGSWASCSSPASFSGLSVGPHHFEVRAVDGALIDATPAMWDWTITPTTTGGGTGGTGTTGSPPTSPSGEPTTPTTAAPTTKKRACPKGRGSKARKGCKKR